MSREPTKQLKDIAARALVSEYLSHRDYLQMLFERMKAETTSYSYLKFAADLGFSATNVMRLVITGQRPLSVKAGLKIADALALHGDLRRYWVTLVRYALERDSGERDRLFQWLVTYKSRSQPQKLNQTEMEYFSEWYHPVVREMVGLADFDGTPEWLKAHIAFPLRLEQVRRSLELLVKIGVITFDKRAGRYVKRQQVLATHDEIDSHAIIRFHQKMIDMGRESITTTDEDQRDIRAATISIPMTAVPILKEKIRAWLEEAVALETQTQPNEVDAVYQLNIQLFPFTKG